MRIVKEKRISDQKILRTEFNRKTKSVIVPTSFEPVIMIKDTKISENIYHKKTWGPFSWYEIL